LESWHEVGQAAGLIALHDSPLDVGPTRHGTTRNQTIYFFDHLATEVFSGSFVYYSEK
jgi:catechol 2,3-dioxygenase